ncbi:MAG: metallophosphoesterase [Thermodesulfovibrionales bacterium]|nr:metallophosphoesterase [Thermodesulfovibrionales bacterium]
MKIGIISDIHLGDGNCKLVQNGKVTNTYDTLKNESKKFTHGNALDYLILNGDILDFSISSFEESCRIAKPFFHAIKKDNLAQQIVYIPGNHDKHVWDAVEWETSIIRKLKRYKNPEKFKRTQPGLIDYEKGLLDLPGVSKVRGTDRYGTLFLEGLFKRGNVLPMNIAYPNLYIRTPTDTYLVTHGHMLELAWVLLSELLNGIIPEPPQNVGIAELEEFNIPLTSMICTGVGQAGDVSNLFYQIQQESKRGKTETLNRVLEGVIPRLDKLILLPKVFEFVDNLALSGLKKAAIHIAENVKDSRYNEYFLKDESVRNRFLRFYEASCDEAKNLGLNSPWKIIFGHTHEPFSYNNPFVIKEEELPQLKVEKVLFYNTGGWLRQEGKSAEVFFIDDNGSLLSVNIQ